MGKMISISEVSELTGVTIKIGLYKYCHQYGMVVHNGAGMVKME